MLFFQKIFVHDATAEAQELRRMNVSTTENATEAIQPATEPAAPVEKKIGKVKFTLELGVAILLALTALAMAWAGWIGELHQSEQAEHYATGQARFSEGTSGITETSVELSSAMAVWNKLIELQSQSEIYREYGEDALANKLQSQIDFYIDTLVEEESRQEVREALANHPIENLYDIDTLEKYYAQANDTLEEGRTHLEEGNKSNLFADSFGLVRVLYSIVMFLLAAIGIYKETQPKKILLGVSVVIFAIATVYMFSLPMPAEFDMTKFLTASR